MRKVIYGAACSLDGYIAGPADEVDWLHWSDDVAAISIDLWQRIDVVLMGRKTYEVAVRNGIRSYPGVRNIVFSRSLSAADWPEVEVVTDDPAQYVRRLRSEPGLGVCVMGGGELAGSLMAAGLVDEVGVNIQPVLLGGGVPFLPPAGIRVGLELTETRRLSGGCIYALYQRASSAGAERLTETVS